MSVSRTDSVDAVTVRDGWAVVSVHEFGPWEEIDDPVATLTAKLWTSFEHVATPEFLERLHRLPVRVELVSRDPVPDEIAAICRVFGVDVVAGD